MKELSIEEKSKAYEMALEKAEEIIRYYKEHNRGDEAAIEDLETIFPELKENKMEWIEKIRQELISYLGRREVKQISESDACLQWIAWLEKQKELTSDEEKQGKEDVLWCIDQARKHAKDENEMGTCWFAEKWLEKQGYEPNWCHHKVDLSNCSEEYCKAYYDGWNNCNMQHSQCKSESNDVIKCLINGMKFYYEDNEDAMWGTEKFSMKVKDILDWLEKQNKLPEGCVRKQVAEAKEALYSAPCVDTINGQGITNQVSQSEVTKISDIDEQMISKIKFAVSQMSSERQDTKKECLNWLEDLRERL